MPSKKRNLEKVEAATVKASKEDKPAQYEEVGKELIRLIGLAERGELPVSDRRIAAPRSQARIELDSHIDRMADRMKGAKPASEPAQIINEDKTVDAESGGLLSAAEYFSWVRNRFKV